MIYAGFGSRDTPPEVCRQMTRIAEVLARNGWTLRSGGAKGADRAFERGAEEAEILQSSDCTEEARRHASQYHPAWHRCSFNARCLHGRNSMILLGPKLDSPVRFGICWTPGGRVVRGTGQALRVAEAAGIPVLNIGKPETLDVSGWLADQGIYNDA